MHDIHRGQEDVLCGISSETSPEHVCVSGVGLWLGGGLTCMLRMIGTVLNILVTILTTYMFDL